MRGLRSCATCNSSLSVVRDVPQDYRRVRCTDDSVLYQLTQRLLGVPCFPQVFPLSHVTSVMDYKLSMLRHEMHASWRGAEGGKALALLDVDATQAGRTLQNVTQLQLQRTNLPLRPLCWHRGQRFSSGATIEVFGSGGHVRGPGTTNMVKSYCRRS